MLASIRNRLVFIRLAARSELGMTIMRPTIIRAFTRYLLQPSRLAACAVAFILADVAVGVIELRDGYEAVDFTAFWAASWLALNHAAGTVYDTAKIAQAHAVVFPDGGYVYQWLYPPTYLFFVLPLALVPYAVSFGAWTVSTLVGYAWALSKIAKGHWLALALLAFPGTLMNVLTGQNGMLLAALFTAAAWNLERRPIIAGVFIGLISVKPQFGVLWPIVLLCGGHWQALASAAITTAALALSAAIAFGPELWVAFTNQVAAIQLALDSGHVSWIKIPTFYGGGRLLGLDQDIAYLIHFALSAAVTTAAGLMWFRQPAMPLRIAALAVATLLVLPRLLVYDFALLLLPLILMAREGLSTGWRPWERLVLILCWLAPLLGLVIAVMAKIQIAPFLLLALFLMILHRSRSIATAKFRQ